MPTGRSVLDVLQLSGICADGLLAARDEERRQNLRNGLRWHQGENDPNPRGWKTIDRLAQVDPSWFCRLVPDETRPIRFAVIDGVTGSVETFTTLTLKRVAGQAQRITFREAEITLDDWLAAHVGGDATATTSRRCGPRSARRRAATSGACRRCAPATSPGSCRSPGGTRRRATPSSRPRATCGAASSASSAGPRRATRPRPSTPWRTPRTAAPAPRASRRSTTDAAADDDLVGLCQLEVRRWVKGSDPADATVDLLSLLPWNDVAVGLEETDATCIEVRLVDATHNTRPIEDLRVSLNMNIYPQGERRRRRPAQRGADGGAATRERARPRGARGARGRPALPPVPAMPAVPPRPPRAPVAPPAPAPEPAAPPAPAPAPRRKAKTGGERRGKKRPRAESNGTFAEAVLASVTCPISQSLVVRPVIAEDGKTYERAHIERWLRQKKSSPLTNQRMGTRLAEHGDGRSIVASAIGSSVENMWLTVDANAAAAWHLASARLKIVGELPGGLASAKEHLAAVASSPECDREETSLSDRAMLLEAFTLREQVKSFVARAGERGLGSEVVRLLTVDHPSARCWCWCP